MRYTFCHENNTISAQSIIRGIWKITVMLGGIEVQIGLNCLCLSVYLSSVKSHLDMCGDANEIAMHIRIIITRGYPSIHAEWLIRRVIDTLPYYPGCVLLSDDVVSSRVGGCILPACVNWCDGGDRVRPGLCGWWWVWNVQIGYPEGSPNRLLRFDSTGEREKVAIHIRQMQ